jgi:hypothetical protein
VNDKPVVGGLSLELVCGAVAAAFVVAVGLWIAKRKEAAAAAAGPHEATVPDSAPER